MPVSERAGEMQASPTSTGKLTSIIVLDKRQQTRPSNYSLFLSLFHLLTSFSSSRGVEGPAFSRSGLIRQHKSKTAASVAFLSVCISFRLHNSFKLEQKLGWVIKPSWAALRCKWNVNILLMKMQKCSYSTFLHYKWMAWRARNALLSFLEALKGSVAGIVLAELTNIFFWQSFRRRPNRVERARPDARVCNKTLTSNQTATQDL